MTPGAVSESPSKPRGRGQAPTRNHSRPVLHVSHGAKSPGPVASTKSPRGSQARPPRRPAPDCAVDPDLPPRPHRRKRPEPQNPAADTVSLATAIAKAALDKKAAHVEIVDIVGKVDYADYLVLMSAGSERHVHAVTHGIVDALRKQGKRPLSIEGLSAGTWVLVDYGDVVVHIFHAESRALYDLDGLWLDAARVPVEPAPEPNPENTPSFT